MVERGHHDHRIGGRPGDAPVVVQVHVRGARAGERARLRHVPFGRDGRARLARRMLQEQRVRVPRPDRIARVVVGEIRDHVVPAPDRAIALGTVEDQVQAVDGARLDRRARGHLVEVERVRAGVPDAVEEVVARKEMSPHDGRRLTQRAEVDGGGPQRHRPRRGQRDSLIALPALDQRRRDDARCGCGKAVRPLSVPGVEEADGARPVVAEVRQRLRVRRLDRRPGRRRNVERRGPADVPAVVENERRLRSPEVGQGCHLARARMAQGLGVRRGLARGNRSACVSIDC